MPSSGVAPALKCQVVAYIKMAHYFSLRAPGVSSFCTFGRNNKIVLVGFFHLIHLLMIGKGFVGIADLIAYTNILSVTEGCPHSMLDLVSDLDCTGLLT